ncbi:MAG: GGDEF domain-containing protein [Lachnospiraceae bacterium]|jgi:diguanylate cyclase (GGDEF)-like protein|nr:GGDEF domain-containing protein [Lachnospiraceae bacterium]
MAFGLVPLEKRLKDNIKNYSLDHLYDIAGITELLKRLYEVSGICFLLTDRHGERSVMFGSFTGFVPDVVNEPGIKIRVSGRTIAHLYVKESADKEIGAEFSDASRRKLVNEVAATLTREGSAAFAQMETSLYADELEKMLEKEQYQVKHGEKTDALTGVLNSTYFENRQKVIDRSETVPVGIVCANINDWKYVNDTYGDEESDRLIKVVAGVIKEEAKPEYVIGRCGGDFFYILIPLAAEGETEDYVQTIKARFAAYEDDKLAPSVACGTVIKTNVEQSIKDLMSDAEYEMFEDKIRMKNEPGYRERLEKR